MCTLMIRLADFIFVSKLQDYILGTSPRRSFQQTPHYQLLYQQAAAGLTRFR